MPFCRLSIATSELTVSASTLSLRSDNLFVLVEEISSQINRFRGHKTFWKSPFRYREQLRDQLLQWNAVNWLKISVERNKNLKSFLRLYWKFIFISKGLKRVLINLSLPTSFFFIGIWYSQFIWTKINEWKRFIVIFD